MFTLQLGHKLNTPCRPSKTAIFCLNDILEGNGGLRRRVKKMKVSRLLKIIISLLKMVVRWVNILNLTILTFLMMISFMKNFNSDWFKNFFSKNQLKFVIDYKQITRKEMERMFKNLSDKINGIFDKLQETKCIAPFQQKKNLRTLIVI